MIIEMETLMKENELFKIRIEELESTTGGYIAINNCCSTLVIGFLKQRKRLKMPIMNFSQNTLILILGPLKLRKNMKKNMNVL